MKDYRLENLERGVDALNQTLEKLNEIMTELRISLAERYMTKDDVLTLMTASTESEAAQRMLLRWAVGVLFALDAALFTAVLGFRPASGRAYPV